MFLNPTFRALDDKEFEAFKQKQEQRRKEDEANALLMQKLKDFERK